jgi:hypothetical protein
VIQAVILASAALLPAAAWLERGVVRDLAWVLAATTSTHLLMVLGETTLPHVTAHARLATHNMVAGPNARFFWAGVVLLAAGALAPVLGVAVVPLVLLGLLCHEHAYVQAGQSVPLA